MGYCMTGTLERGSANCNQFQVSKHRKFSLLAARSYTVRPALHPAEKKSFDSLTHYHPAMPFGNRKKYLRGSFQFSLATIQKNISPCIPEIQLFRHFPKLKIAYFNGKNPFNFS